jgi:glycosyltransferase involved in cell wall biosynthesis
VRLPRVAVIHNRYQQPGGEDVVFASEAELLERNGHEVVRYELDNDAIGNMGRVALARTTVWNGAAYAELRRLFASHRPDIAHFHNTFPLVSPAGYYAARREGVAVVQTLHNFRLACPNALFYRDGHVCEDCSGKVVPWPGVLHACYRGSRAASGVTAAMLAVHRLRGTWSRMVDVYIALTAFARERFVAHGLPAERIAVKPNFVPADASPVGEHRGAFALYAGRLVAEKGVQTMLDAWDRARLPSGFSLKVVGSGPLESLRDVPRPGVEWLGHQPAACVAALMRDAAFLVFPSEWYEGFPLTLAEAFAAGLPVIASREGAAAEIVEHGRTGRHFRSGDPADLADQLEWASTHDAEMARMGQAARAVFEAKYTAERNYTLLLDSYRAATARLATR